MDKTPKSLYKQAVVSTQLSREEDYWTNKLAGELIRSVFPYDRKKTQNSYSSEPESVKFRLTGDIFSKLMKLSNGSDYRLHMILAAALLVLLNKYTDNKDIIIGTPTLKQDFEAEFINTALALRNRIDKEDMTFKELLLQMRQTITEANENQNYPIEQLPHRIGMTVSQDGDFPLFDIVIMLENIQEKAYVQHIHTNIIFSFFRTDEAVEGVVEYNSILYHKTTIERITSHFSNLLEEILFNVDVKIIEIDILSHEEKNQLLFDFNNTKADYPGNKTGKTIHELFEKQVEKTPDHVALIGQIPNPKSQNPNTLGEDISITYKELNKKSNRCAHLLKEKGVKPDTIVGIMVESSIEMIKGLLAILKAGGAYLPIEPYYPGDRIKMMLADSNAKVLVTTGKLAKEVEKLRSWEGKNRGRWEGEVVLVEEPLATDNRVPPPVAPVFPVSPVAKKQPAASLAYIIYTSGTTGIPKGILIQHKNLVNYVCWRIKTYNYTSADVTLQLLSPAFDGFGANLYHAVLTGGKVVLADRVKGMEHDYVGNLIRKEKVTNFSVVPYMYRALLEVVEPGSLETLRFVVLAGERAGKELIASSQNQHPQIALVNEYGPTEATVGATAHRGVTPENVSVIGTPVFNTSVFILKEGRNLAPLGVPGELCISGTGIARGYLNRPELTAERFLHVFHRSYKSYMSYIYRTGDLARWLPNGNIEFLDRIDHQVKIRGFRIEVEEIEEQLLTHEEIKKTLVLAKEDEKGDKCLCAYIVPQAPHSLNPYKLRKYLLKGLPEYMIPSHFIFLDQIPLTPNGKIDRKLLPEPEIKSGKHSTAPRNEVEEQLAEIWSEVLGIETNIIVIDSNFFELGGHSLNATVMSAKIHKKLDIKISLVDIFKAPTIEELASLIKTINGDENEKVPINQDREEIIL